MSDHDALPTIAASQRAPLLEQLLEQVEQLLEANRRQAEQIQQLRDEIAILKGEKARPRFKPSGMEAATDHDLDANADGEAGSGGASVHRASAPARRNGARRRS